MNEKITALTTSKANSDKYKQKGNELKRVINGIPMILRFSDTENTQATSLIQDIMLKSLGNKTFKNNANFEQM